jgi:hypothetical protein
MSVPVTDPALDVTAPTTVVEAGPDQNVKGIVPPTDVTC